MGLRPIVGAAQSRTVLCQSAGEWAAGLASRLACQVEPGKLTTSVPMTYQRLMAKVVFSPVARVLTLVSVMRAGLMAASGHGPGPGAAWGF